MLCRKMRLMLNHLRRAPAAERVQVTVRSLYKIEAKEAAADSDEVLDIFAVDEEEEDKWRERDSITVTLTERGEGAMIRSGAFIGKLILAAVEPGTTKSCTPTNSMSCR